MLCNVLTLFKIRSNPVQMDMGKLKILLILCSIVILTLLVAGCGSYKATGGGWFTDFETDNYITFGFNGQPVGEPYLAEDLLPGPEGPEDAWVRDAKGQFQFVDQTLGIVIHGKFLYTSVDLETTDNSAFMGECTVNGVGPYMFVAKFDDVYVLPEFPFTVFEDANFIMLFVDINGTGDIEKGIDIFYEGVLGGGSIRIHTK